MQAGWFKARKEELGLRDEQIAQALGVSRTVANKFVNGKVALDARRAEALAKLFEVSRDEILYQGGISSEPPSPSSRLNQIVTTNFDEAIAEIIKLDLSLSMGPGTLIGDYVEETTYKFDQQLLRLITRSPANRLRMVTGIGDSMYPTLAHGDYILIDTTDRMLARQDGIYWIDLHGAAGLKRLRTVGRGRVLVKSDNPAVGDQEVDAEDLRIDGRAIWFMRGL